MPDITGLFAILGTFGMAPAIIYLRGKAKLDARRLEPLREQQRDDVPALDP